MLNSNQSVYYPFHLIYKQESELLNLKRKIGSHFEHMANTPKAQIIRLAIGASISALSILILTFVSTMEIRWLFYLLVFTTLIGILYAIPGYIGIWLWRMRNVLFRKNKD